MRSKAPARVLITLGEYGGEISRAQAAKALRSLAKEIEESSRFRWVRGFVQPIVKPDSETEEFFGRVEVV